ncbi:unnamed protein product, partial [marine sediment metagenome]
HLAAGDLTGASSGFALFFIKWYALRLGKMVEAHKADIMAVMGINTPRIA